MRNRHHLSILLIIGLVTFGSLLITPQPVWADAVDDLASIFDYAGSIPNFPVNGRMIRNARGLFDCLDQPGADPLVCINNFHNTEVGQAALSGVVGGDLPSWFWNLLQAYIDIKTNNFWGVVADLGEAVICAVAQVLAGGMDLCALVEEIVKTLYEVGKAIVQFFEDLGEAVWNALKSAYCYVFGCDDDSPPPPLAQLFYDGYYAPRSSDGLQAIETMNSSTSYMSNGTSYALNNLIGKIEGAIVKVYGSTQTTFDAIKQAESQFKPYVLALWDADIVQRVLPDQGQKRSQFNGPTEIGLHAYGATQAYEASPTQSDPVQFIIGNCTKTFADTFGYAHVDLWIKNHTGQANTLQAVTNRTWCSDTFWKKNQSLFADRFRYYLTQGTKWCQDSGQKLTCDTAGHYKACLALLGSVGQQDQCSVDMAKSGKEIAEEIRSYFKAQGSTIPCPEIKTYGPNAAVDLVCSRPTQGNACNQYYSNHYGKLPITMVNCKVQETTDYTTLKNRLQTVVDLLRKNEAINPSDKSIMAASQANDLAAKQAEKMGSKIPSKEEGKKSGVPSAAAGDFIKVPAAVHVFCDPALETGYTLYQDPLYILGSTCLVDKVKNDPNQNFGFGAPSATPGFDYNNYAANTIDGASTPVLNAKATGADKDKLGKIIKDKEMTTVTPESQLKKILGSDNPAEEMKKLGYEKVVHPDPGTDVVTGPTKEYSQTGGSRAGALTTNVQTQLKGGGEVAMTSALPGPSISKGELSGTQGQTTVMMGKLPDGSGPKTGMARAPSATPTPAPPPPPALPDLSCTGMLRVGGLPVPWGGLVTIDAGKALTINKNNSGLCEFQMDYGVRNTGTAATGNFRNLWTNMTGGGSWPSPCSPIQPAGMINKTDLLLLKPGSNTLQLVVDDLNQIKESNKLNNTFRITVVVTGSCSPAAPSQPEVSPAPVTLPKAPVAPIAPPPMIKR